MPLAAPIELEYVVVLKHAYARLLRKNAALERTNTGVAQASAILTGHEAFGAIGTLKNVEDTIKRLND